MKKIAKRLPKIAVFAILLVIIASFAAFGVGAEEVSQVPITTSIQPVIDAATAQLTVANVMLVLAAGVGVGIGLVLAWFGVRKLLKILMSAFTKGKLHV